jgi:pyruvate formate lyase activating enzyme
MQSSASSEVMGKEAELQVRLANGRIKCTACARLCEIPEGKTGLCGIRGVTNNNLYLYVYGRVIAGNIDPIEKKTCDTLQTRFSNLFYRNDRLQLAM